MSDLRGQQMPEDEAGSKKNKLYGAAIVAAAIGAVGIFGYATGMWNSPPPPKPATFNVVSNQVPTPAPPPVEMGTPTPVVPAAAPVREVIAPTLPARKAPTIKAARVHLRAPAAPAEISPVVMSPVAAPIVAPIDIAPPPAPIQAPPVQTAPALPVPEQVAPIPPAQPQP